MAFSQVDKSVAIDWFNNGVYGYYTEGGLDEYDTDAEPQLQAGFKVEVGDDIYLNDTALSGTGWSGIANDTQVYLYIVPSGTTATLVYSATAPTWSSTKAGWYNSNDRAIWTCYKNTAGTGYYHKQELKGRSVTTGGTTVTSLTYSTNPTNGVDFTVYEPGVYYGKFDTITTNNVGLYGVIEAKVDGGYTQANVIGFAEINTAIASTDRTVTNKSHRVLLPGVYRLSLVATSAPGNTPTCTVYRAGRLSNNL